MRVAVSPNSSTGYWTSSAFEPHTAQTCVRRPRRVVANNFSPAEAKGRVTGKIDVREVPAVSVADRARFRLILGAEVIDNLAHRKSFGRVKFQKVLYLTEVHAGCAEMGGRYLREAAGPLDRDMMLEMDEELARVGHAIALQPEGAGGQVRYEQRGAKGAYRGELVAMLGARTVRLDQLIALVADLDTKSIEAVATLYAVWNDLMLDGLPVADETIVSGVLNDWHPEKREKFRPDELFTWLGWMRRHELVPVGTEPRTHQGRLFT